MAAKAMSVRAFSEPIDLETSRAPGSAAALAPRELFVRSGHEACTSVGMRDAEPRAAAYPEEGQPVRHFIVLLATSGALAACSSSYHPEYHPVTVSHYSQSVSYPTVLPAGGAPSVIMNVPPPQPPPTNVPEWPNGN
jgi:hypothetical protein